MERHRSSDSVIMIERKETVIGENDHEDRDPKDEAKGKAQVSRLQKSAFLCL